MRKKTSSYKEWLIKKLKDPAHAEGYLNAALLDDDPRVFLLALKDVAEARGGMSKVAEKAHLNRESLYKTFSARGNPKLNSLQNLLGAMGFNLSVQAITKRKRLSA